MSQQVLQYISDSLSLVTIGLCFILKVPQVTTLVKRKSAVGISFLGLLLELTSYSVTTSYNFVNGYSLLSYLEVPIILIQQYILIYLVLNYLNLKNIRALLAVLIYFTIFISFLTQIIPKTLLMLFVPLVTPISACSKIAQLTAILRAKNADSVSVLSWFISAFTNLTRVFTTWMDSADVLLLANYIISVTLSSSVMFVAIYYKMKVKKVE